MTFTQGGIHEARMIFKNSTGDKKIIVLLSDGEANRIYEPKIDLDDYMNNNKRFLREVSIIIRRDKILIPVRVSFVP